jgi:O-antigen ligase
MPNAITHSEEISTKPSRSTVFMSEAGPAWLIAFVPALLAVMSWDADGIITASNYSMRHYGWPVTLAELVVIWAAVKKGWRIKDAIAETSLKVRLSATVWMIAACAAVAVNEDWVNSGYITFRYFVHGVYFAALLGLATRMQNPFNISYAITAGMVLYIAALSVFAISIAGSPDFPWVNRLPSATNVRQIGYYVALMAVAPLTLILFKDKGTTWPYALSFGLATTFISWSGSRASLIGVGLGSVLALLVTAPKSIWRRLLVVSCVMISGVVASLSIPSPAPEFGIVRIVHATTSEDVSSGRTDIWIKTVTEIQAKPLLGHGAGSFRKNMAVKHNTNLNQPHQFVLQYLYDWGVIGALPILYLLGLLAQRALNRARKRPSSSAFLGLSALFTATVIALIDGAFYSPLSIALTLVMLVALVGKAETDQPAKSS